MKRISFNEGTLIFNGNQVVFEISDKTHQLEGNEDFGFLTDLWSFPTQIHSLDDEFKLIYQVEPGFIPFERARIQLDRDAKLNMAEDLMAIGQFFHSQTRVATVFQPINFFANEQGSLKMLYRGLVNVMPAMGYQNEPIFEQVKRMVLLLFTSARFDELRINGNAYANQKLMDENKRIAKRILQTTSFGEMRRVFRLEYEEIVAEEIKQEPEEQKSVSFFTRIKERFRSKKKNPSLPVSAKIKSVADQRTNENRKMKFIIAGMGLLFAIYLMIQFIPTDDSANDPSVQASTGETIGKPVKVNENLLKALRYSAVMDYGKAAMEFDKLDFKSLAKEDQKAMLTTYILSHQPQKALDRDPSYAEYVVNYYEKIGRLKDLQKLKTNSPVILFEQAILKKDLVKAQELLKQVKVNENRGRRMINLMISLNKKEDALKFAKGSGIAQLVNYAQAKIQKK